MIVLTSLLLTAVSVAAYPGYPVYDNNTLAQQPAATNTSAATTSAAASPSPILNVSAYLIILAVFGSIIFLSAVGFCFRHSRYNPWRSPTPPPTSANFATSESTRRARRGVPVWRADVEDGVPTYTVEASDGELSLGIGARLKLNDDDIEMDSVQGEHPEPATDELHETEGETSAILPPYIPPPRPAAAATTESGAHRAQGNRRNVSLTAASPLLESSHV